MFGVEDEYFALLVDLMKQNDLILNVDKDGFLLFSNDNDNDSIIVSQNIGHLIGTLLYDRSLGLGTNSVLDIKQLKLIDSEKYELLYDLYVWKTNTLIETHNHPLVQQLDQLLEDFQKAFTLVLDLDEQFNVKPWIPRELFLHYGEGEDMVTKQFSPSTLKNEDLISWLKQRGIEDYVQEHLEDNDISYKLLKNFTISNVHEEIFYRGYNLTLEGLVNTAFHDFSNYLKELFNEIVTEDKFIELCFEDDSYFNANGDFINGDMIPKFLGFDVVD